MMTQQLLARLSLVALLAALFIGCSKQAPLPDVMPLAGLTTEFKQAFATATPELKSAADDVLARMEKKDYVGAYKIVDGLRSVPELTEQQRWIATCAVMTFSQEIQTAQQQGDKAATDFTRGVQQSK